LGFQHRLQYNICRTGSAGWGRTQKAVILSEAKNLFSILVQEKKQGEILCFAQNDRSRHFSRSLSTLAVLLSADKTEHTGGRSLQKAQIQSAMMVL